MPHDDAWLPRPHRHPAPVDLRGPRRLFHPSRQSRRDALRLVGTVVLAGPGRALAQPRSLGPREALLARMSLLLVVAPPDRTLPDEEAIGDWAYYLNRAVADRPAGVTVSRIALAGFRELLAAPVIRQEYATLFVRSDRAALLHQGLVLDPPVYTAGFAFLSDGMVPSGDLGLIATRVRPR